MGSYELFIEQKNRFVDALYKYDHDIWLTFNPKSLNQYNPSNWFMMFNPKCWGKFLKGFGIHYGLVYYVDSYTKNEYVRLPVGVENPFRLNLRNKFKMDVVSYVKQNDINIGNCRLWPDVGFHKKKLIESELIELNDHSWGKAIETYMMLKDFNNVVANFIGQYNTEDSFIENRYDPA